MPRLRRVPAARHRSAGDVPHVGGVLLPRHARRVQRPRTESGRSAYGPQMRREVRHPRQQACSFDAPRSHAGSRIVVLRGALMARSASARVAHAICPDVSASYAPAVRRAGSVVPSLGSGRVPPSARAAYRTCLKSAWVMREPGHSGLRGFVVSGRTGRSPSRVLPLQRSWLA